MIIQENGEIADGIYSLGSTWAPLFLIDGENPVLIDAGFSFLGEIYAREIRKITGTRQPSCLVLTHAHFDHCGAAGVLKSIFPKLKIAASAKAKKILQRPNAVKLIKQLNKEAADGARESGLDLGLKDWRSFEPFEVDITLKEGSTIRISENCILKALETPGHTWDCLSYYIDPQKALFTGEAAGIAGHNGHIYSEWLVNYDSYYKSLKKLSQLDVMVLGPGHNFIFTEKDARQYLQASLKECVKYLALIVNCLAEENKDLQQVANRIKKLEYDQQPEPKQTESAYMLNLKARIKTVLRRVEKEEKMAKK